MKLLVRNLARRTTEAELRALFEAHGAVQSCTLIIDKETGNSKGFGFVEMPRQGEAKAAMKNLNGKDVAGSRIRVKKAEVKPDTGARDPLHGITLKVIVTRLVEKYGWEELGQHIKIKCFTRDPSIASSLKFLRKTPWARQKVEMLYLQTEWPPVDAVRPCPKNNDKT